MLSRGLHEPLAPYYFLVVAWPTLAQRVFDINKTEEYKVMIKIRMKQKKQKKLLVLARNFLGNL